MPVRSQQLLDLQALDSEAGRLSRQLQQTEAALADQSKARAAELANRQAEEALRARQTEQRDREFELAAMEAREAARVEQARIRAATKRVLEETAAGQAQLRDAREQLRAAVQRCGAQRAQLVGALDGPSLALYERLRQRL